MEEKTFKISIPDGYEIDSDKSTFENIVFKKKQEKRWRDDEGNPSQKIEGYYVDHWESNIVYRSCLHTEKNRNLFATEKQAKSALAMAQISQIMEHDPRFGGPITDEEWNDEKIYKYSIKRLGNTFLKSNYNKLYNFLSFHNNEQCNLFLKENLDLVKDYLMIE